MTQGLSDAWVIAEEETADAFFFGNGLYLAAVGNGAVIEDAIRPTGKSFAPLRYGLLLAKLAAT